MNRRKLLAIAAGLLALTVAAFLGVLRLPFASFDDPEYVLLNPFVRTGLSWRNVATSLTSGHAANWHPLTWISHMVDVSVFGLDPAGPHAVNLLLHGANAVLLFALLVRTTAAPWRSALAAALFAVHPLRVESVAWVSERKDVLSALFWLATTHAYVGWVRTPGRARYATMLALFALGLASKQMLVTLPFTLLLLDAWPLARIALVPLSAKAAWPLVREKVPLFALSAAASAVTFLVQSGAGATRPLAGIPLPQRLANAATSVGTYLAKSFWPSSLAVFYPYPEAPPSALALAATLSGLAAVTAMAWSLRRRMPSLVVGWLWFLGTLVPVLGLVQVGNQALADRYTYLPSIGLAVAAVWALPSPRPGSRAQVALAACAAAAVLGSLVALTMRQVEHWTSDRALFEHALAVTERNWVAETAVGTDRERRGDLGGALEHYRRALRIRPDAPQALHNLGNLLVTAGRPEEGIAHLREAVRLWPGYVGALSNLGAALAETGRVEEGARHLSEAVRRAPDHVPARYNLAQALLELGQLDAAIAEMEAVVRLEPGDAEARLELDRLRARKAR